MIFSSSVPIIVIVAFYLLPTFIAGSRASGHQNTIFIDLRFGWIAALISAIVEVPMPSKPRARSRFSEPSYK